MKIETKSIEIMERPPDATCIYLHKPVTVYAVEVKTKDGKYISLPFGKNGIEKITVEKMKTTIVFGEKCPEFVMGFIRTVTLK